MAQNANEARAANTKRMQVARQDDAYREAENAAQRLQRKCVNIDQSKGVNARFRVFLDRNFDASCNVRDRPWFDNNLTMIASVTDDEKQQCIKCLRRRLKQTAVPTENLPKLATHDGSKAIRLKKLSLAGHHADQVYLQYLAYSCEVSTVPWGSSETLPGSSERSFRGTDSGDATTIDSEQHVAFAKEQHSVAFFCAQCKTVITPNSMLCFVGVGCTCAEVSVRKACTGTQTTASNAALRVDKKGLVNVTSLGERSRATRVTSRLASHKIGQATAALQFDLPVAHKSVQCIPRVKSKSTQFSATGTRTSRTLQTRRAVNRPSSGSALKTISARPLLSACCK
ncbi:uncharacterized protein [Dermacentor andersoni]|uniref:uncharacterized protein isoform X2 n=1 Tax=Dermacentor andersoni TaxID=34620 RepID=UPI002415D1EF|nr:uncharacterized protein LOC126526292 isoform X2 [Dermacentor andersoni]